jgi:hypothetical protein
VNDLDELTTFAPPQPPSSAAHTAARAALMQRIAGGPSARPSRRPRRAWVIGTSAVATALAATVGFATIAAHPKPANHPSGQQAGQQTGQQVLLAFARVAAATPPTTGTYWHLRLQIPVDGTVQTLETWTTQDGKTYALSPGVGVVLTVPGGALSLGAATLTFDQLEQLPTDPDALTAWIRDSYGHPSPPVQIPGMPAPPVPIMPSPAEVTPDMLVTQLCRVLYDLPAPPAVRAAALQALAAQPTVTDLGPRDGGEALRIAYTPPSADKFPNGEVPAGADSATLVIDPATAMLISVTNYQGTVTVLSAEWTDTMPPVVTP